MLRTVRQHAQHVSSCVLKLVVFLARGTDISLGYRLGPAGYRGRNNIPNTVKTTAPLGY
eukprot:m.570803 g.570803  ORF g.570803 m.570803 type:complete len:59 (+) comp22264_c0_seq6:160-336(+)